MAAEAGVVHLVGIGPGDPELLTIRGRELIARADAVVYGPGIPRAFLAHHDVAGGGRAVYNVGAHGRRAALGREEVRQLVIGLARQGQRVVHLLYGDPFTFGVGSDEAQALHDAGVDFEVVPGIPAALAAPAFAGIPVTSGALARAVTLVHGRESGGAVDWRAIARAGGTLVVRDARAIVSQIATGFAAAGGPPDIPAAAIVRATRAGQHTVVATLGTMADAIERAGMRGTITLVVGWTVLLRDELAWFEHRALAGRRIAVSGGAAGDATAARLRELGAVVGRIPERRVARLDLTPLREAVASVAAYDWLVFAGAPAVELFWEQLLVAGLDTRALAGRQIAAVGADAAATLLDRGVTVDLVQDRFGAEPLLAAFAGRDDLAGATVLYVADDADPDALAEPLAAAGALVTSVAPYRRAAIARRGAALHRALGDGRVALVALASVGAVQDYARWAGDAVAAVPVAAADEATADAATALGADVVVRAGGRRLGDAVAEHLGASPGAH